MPRFLMAAACWLTVGIIASGGCSRDSDQPSDSPATDYNVLLITLDTTRADHLGCYGHPVSRTPNIDRLAREGVQFNQCSASAPITLPSHCTIMTGTEPYYHGIRANGAFPLGPSNVTLAEILKAQGYQTAARVGAFVLDARWGLAQGFDSYQGVEAPTQHEPAPDKVGGRFAIQPHVFAERKGEEVRTEAIRWLREHGNEKFFLWTHFFDPHRGYEPPEPYLTAYRDPYVGEIAYADEQVGHLLTALEELGIQDKTLVVLTADHGEGLYEHEEPTHLHFVYDTTMRVPLIFWAPGGIPGRDAIGAQVRLKDVVPTILELLGLPEKSDAQGVALGPLMFGQTDDLELTAYGESFFPYFAFGYSQIRSLRAGGWKYMHLPTPELYHVAQDPKELTNLAEQEADRVETMRDELYAILAEAPRLGETAQAAPVISEEDIRKLAAIGYVDVSSEAAAAANMDELEYFEPRGDDPKDHSKEVQLLGMGIGAIHAENYPMAERFLRPLIEEGEATPVILKWYVEALVAQNKLDEVLALLEKVTEDKPDYASAYNDWGLLLHRKGRNPEAVERYRKALSLKPEALLFRSNLANALIDIGELDEAEAHLKLLQEKDPDNTDACNGFGNILMAQKQYAAAAEMYTKAAELNPNRATYVYNLGRALFMMDRLDEAVQSYRRALERQPDHTNAYWNLGVTYRKQGKVDEAIEAYREMLRLDPGQARVASDLARSLAERGDHARAIALYREVVERAPEYRVGVNNLAWLLATSPDASLRNGQEAVRLAQKLAEQTDHKHPGALDTLAAALAEVGQFDRAVETIRQAVEFAASGRPHNPAGNTHGMEARLELYTQGKPYREPAGPHAATQPESP